MQEKLTQKKIRELFDYNPDVGVLKWKKPRSPRVATGDEAGCVDKSTGYRQVYIGNKAYYTHRLIWFFVHGYFPEHQVDHINRDRLDNRINNLREVSQSCNNKNTGLRNDNKSGITGVSWDNNRGQWEVKISNNGRQRSLGRYRDFSDAVCARLAGEQCINFGLCNSASRAFKYVKTNILKEQI